MGPLVSIVTFTYNHEKYISQTLDGFIMQKTNFDFDIIIHDDASTDTTQSIIKKYEKKFPNLIRPIYQKKNQKSRGSGIVTRIAFGLIRGKYVALCEGDDYWTDPFKLQNQVNFLEANDTYAMCCTDYDVLDNISGAFERNYLSTKYLFNSATSINIEEYILKRFQIRTLTVLFRHNAYLEFLKSTSDRVLSNYAAGDFPIWIYFLARYKVRYLPQSTSVYRVTSGSASRPVNAEKKYLFQKEISDVNLLMADQFGLSYSVKRELKIRAILIEMQYEAERKNISKVFYCFYQLLILKKINKAALVYIIMSINTTLGKHLFLKYLE